MACVTFARHDLALDEASPAIAAALTARVRGADEVSGWMGAEGNDDAGESCSLPTRLRSSVDRQSCTDS